MMTSSLRRLAGLTSDASNWRVVHFCAIGPAGALVSATGAPSVYRPWAMPALTVLVRSWSLPHWIRPKRMASGGMRKPPAMTTALTSPIPFARR